MQVSRNKAIAVIAVIMMMASTVLMTMPAQAQLGWGYGRTLTNVVDRGSVALPAGVTPDFTVNWDQAFLSCRPNPVGVGQTVLVNMWLDPAISVIRYIRNYKVTMTKPDGTTEVKTLDSYPADTTAWYEFSPDVVGTWKLKFDMPGAYWPAGNVTEPPGFVAGAGGGANYSETYYKSCYYAPCSSREVDLVVQQDWVQSWPGAALPTDLWSRGITLMNREWWPIAGNYPATGYEGGGSTWDQLYPDTTPTWNSRATLTPWVQAPDSAHFVWGVQRVGNAGLIGGQAGQYGTTSSSGTPTIIYEGRCYQTVTKPMQVLVNGTYVQQQTSVWECYDLRTGQVYWDQTGMTTTPSIIEYAPPAAVGEVTGAEAANTWAVSLIAVSGNRLMKWSTSTGSITFNNSIPTFGTSTYYKNGYVLSVQTLNTTGNEDKTQHVGGTDSAGSATAGVYRLINWTTYGTSTDFNTRIVSNISWPRSNLGTTQDFNAGLCFQVTEQNFFDLGTGNTGFPFVDIYYDNATGARWGCRIRAYSLSSGQKLWDKELGPTHTIYSSSKCIADHGKLAFGAKNGHWECYDGTSGNLVWTSDPPNIWPWDWPNFGAYSVSSAYGLVFNYGYAGVSAYNWTNGHKEWTYETITNPYETPYTGANGEAVCSFNGGGMIADGKLFVANTEHTPSWPLTRGWRLNAINITDGTAAWTIGDDMSAGAVADGYLTSADSWTGYMWVIGKGASATTVTAPQTAVPLGTSVLIQGTVVDKSDAQPDTPCVSDASMTTQMEYLHQQQPIDGMYHNITLTGVPVTLTAIGSDGSVIDIGSATSNAYYGTYSFTWTPSKEGTYTVTASFGGSASYGSSSAATGVAVGPAPAESSSSGTATVTVPDYTMAIVGAAVAMIIAVAVATVLILRKR